MSDGEDRIADIKRRIEALEAERKRLNAEKHQVFAAAASRWDGHEKIPLATIRVSAAVRDRVQAEIPLPDRRPFVDAAITLALEARKGLAQPDK